MGFSFDKLRSHPRFLLLSAIASGLMLTASWHGFSFLMFFALVPLLAIEDEINARNPSKAGLRFFGYIYISMLLWNIGATWWLANASLPGGVAAWVLNAHFQAWIFMAFRFTKKHVGQKTAYMSLPAYWLAFEYLHLRWQFSWTWLNLGNSLADSVSWIQWYEYTGVFGGGLWLLAVNILLYIALKIHNKKYLLAAALSFVLPLLASLGIYFSFAEKGKDVGVAVIQPNFDCYSQKFEYNAQTGAENKETFVPFPRQIDKFMQLTRQGLKPDTRFVAWPETALHEPLSIAQAGQYPYLQTIAGFFDSLGNTALVAGIDTYETKVKKEEATENARFRQDLGYYDVYSSAMMLAPKRNPTFYHKSQLVIGVETIPLRSLFTMLIMNFGGTSGGLSIQKDREVLYGPDSLGIAPVICYESIFGEYMTEYIENGAQSIFVITNDGWWGNTPGAQQHWRFAKLRAIECRRSVARSANTGVSGFINARGDELARAEYGEETVLSQTIKFDTGRTFYSLNGDWIGRLAVCLCVFFAFSALVRKVVGKSSLFKR